MSDDVTDEPLEADPELEKTYIGWAYLAFLFVLFLFLALFAFACDDDDQVSDAGVPVSTSTSEQPAAVLTPVALVFDVAGDVVTLTGAVPDEGARAQLIDLAVERYGDGNVVDELTIDATSTLTDGTVSVTGATIPDDARPADLQADVSALGLSSAGFDVVFEEQELIPVAAQVQVGGDQVVLQGVLPDQAAVDGLVVSAETVWGVENVDSTGLSVDPDYTLDGGRVQVVGVSDAGDTRVSAFVAAAGSAVGVTIDNEVEVDTGAEALGRLEAQLRAELDASPILFTPGSAEIDAASDEILQRAAAAINAAPGIAVEIVGHTDDQGAEEFNQELSEARATAVAESLAELGVDSNRLTARGAGETEPVADNSTEDGRAANRRIAFEFEGAGDGNAEDGNAEDGAADSGGEEEDG